MAKTSCGSGFNEFSWSSKTVLRRTGLEMAELGAVVRLKREHPGREEWVAPAVLYHSQVPDSISYRFTLKTNGNARVTGEIYQGQERLDVRPQSREIAGHPFTVLFRGKDRPEGWYRLVLSGYFEADNTELAKIVHFYHRPESF